MKKESKLQIECPSCGHQFSPETAIEHNLRIHIEKEYQEKFEANTTQLEERMRHSAMAEFQTKVEALEKESALKNQKITELQKQNLSIAQRERDLHEREQQSELELQKKLLIETERISKESEEFGRQKASLEFHQKEAEYKRQHDSLELRMKKVLMDEVEKVRNDEKFKQAELQKKLDDAVRMADEMKKKSEQGSMQLQGEVQELAIEDFLKSAFPKDEIQEISKGVRGGDCLHIVKDNFGNESGRILYESKRTKSFSKEWIAKLKEDQRSKHAQMAIIVTEAMPTDLVNFGQIDGIWICSFIEMKSVSLLLRYAIERIGEVVAAQDNKGDKMKLLYDYLTGNEFRQKIDTIREAFQQMAIDLDKEKIQITCNWAKREKQILRVMQNTVSLYGDVKGIAGGAVQSIPALDLDNENPPLLKEAS